MKILSLVFMLLFSLTTLADTCAATDVVDECVKVTKTKDCSDKSHPDSDHQEAHCARTCTPKMLGPRITHVPLEQLFYTLTFPQYFKAVTRIDPALLLRPPIA
jgi:hypothetical protein